VFLAFENIRLYFVWTHCKVLRSAFLFFTLLISNISIAAVSERLVYTSYIAKANTSRPLLIILNEATPHHENDLVFHAHTNWEVKLKNIKFVKTEGKCRVRNVKTELNATIDLPNLVGANPLQSEQFEKYLTALREHELGHYAIGKEAATEIDHKIYSLTEKYSCKSLRRAVNKLAFQTIDEYRTLELNYDSSTQNGKLQGAWLDQ